MANLHEILKNPYLVVPRAFWQRGGLKAKERNVLVSLYGSVWAQRRYLKERNCYLECGEWAGSWGDLARLAGYSIDQVRYACKCLQERDLLYWRKLRDPHNKPFLIITLEYFEELSNAKNYFANSQHSPSSFPSQDSDNPFTNEEDSVETNKLSRQHFEAIPAVNKVDKTKYKTNDNFKPAVCEFCGNTGINFNGDKCKMCDSGRGDGSGEK